MHQYWDATLPRTARFTLTFSALLTLGISFGCSDWGGQDEVLKSDLVSSEEGANSGEVFIDQEVMEQAEQGVVVERAMLSYVSAFEAASRLESLGVEVIREYPELKMVGVRALEPNQVEALKAAPGGVVAIHGEQFFEYEVAQAATWIGQPVPIGRGFTGKGVGIAVLDTGVDWTKQDFGSCTAPGAGAGCRVVESLDFAQDDGAMDEDGHGTNVAAIAAGIAPGSSVISLDVFDGKRASSTDILAAVEWILANRGTHNIRVVNMSLGSGRYTRACDTSVFAGPIDTLHKAGIHVVTSSGNDGYSDAVGSPACVSKVLSVGAIYGFDIPNEVDYGKCKDELGVAGSIACFSNASPSLDLLTPGVGVEGGGASYTGTSQAAPVASGALAILAQAYVGESIQAREGRLVRGVAKVQDARSGASYPTLSLANAFDDEVVEPCAYEFRSDDKVWEAQGERRMVAVSTSCGWTLDRGEVPWIESSVNGGEGPDVVEIVVAPNPFMVPRRATVVLRDEQGVDVGQVEVVQAPKEVVEVGERSALMRVFFDFKATPVRQVPVQIKPARGDFRIAKVCLSTEQKCEQWQEYKEWMWLEVGPGDGVKEVWLNVESDRGERLAEPLMQTIRLDTVPPIDGRLSMKAVPGLGVALSWGEAKDENGGVRGYRVVWSSEALPSDCRESEANQLLYEGVATSAEHVLVGAQVSQVFYRVCAVDEALHHSVGRSASYVGSF